MKIGFLELFREKMAKSSITQQVKEEMTLDVDYIVLLVLSIIIATVGIMMDNSTIIIGAMIISPLLWPIFGVALGTVRGDRKFIMQATVSLVVSILITIVTATILSFLLFSGIFEINQEIGSRISPTFLDLIVALAAGFAAPFIVSWGKLTTSAAGVAVAASLLPPLTVTGIGLSVGDMQVFNGSFILFLTNLVSIIFASIIVFRLAGYHRYGEDELAAGVKFGLGASLAVLVVLGVQMFLSLVGIVQSTTLNNIVVESLERELSFIDRDLHVDEITILPFEDNVDIIQVSAIVRTSKELSLTVVQKEIIEDNVAQQARKNIILDLRLLPSLELLSQDAIAQQEILQRNNMIESLSVSFLKTIDALITIDDVAITRRSDLAPIVGNATLKVPVFVNLTDKDRLNLEAFLQEELKTEVDVELSIIEVRGIIAERPELSIEEQRKEEIYTEINAFADNYLSRWNVDLTKTTISYNFDNRTYSIEVTAEAPASSSGVPGAMNALKNHLITTFTYLNQNNLFYQARILTFTEISL